MNEQLRQEFQKLMSADPNSLLTPKAIVEAARDPNSPLHRFFTWDDAEAAEKQRLEEARFLIRHVKIDVPELNIKVRALTTLETGQSSGFLWTKDIIADPKMRRRMLDLALGELLRLENKYSHLEELSELWAVAHEIKNEVEVQ